MANLVKQQEGSALGQGRKKKKKKTISEDPNIFFLYSGTGFIPVGGIIFL